MSLVCSLLRLFCLECVLSSGVLFFFFFKQKTAYEMRISDWSSDVCSSDLPALLEHRAGNLHRLPERSRGGDAAVLAPLERAPRLRSGMRMIQISRNLL